MSATEIVVIEVGAAATQVVTIGADSSPTAVYVPGTGGGAVSCADRPTRIEVTAEIGNAVIAHVLDPSPHPVYDDLPDLTLWFDNALI